LISLGRLSLAITWFVLGFALTAFVNWHCAWFCGKNPDGDAPADLRIRFG
jgi:hypothetical protein